MGLFSSSKKTYVGSVAYNLAGEEDDQIDFLKYTVLQSVMQNKNIADTITSSYLKGQGSSLRSSYNYARDHYFDGLPETEAAFMASPNQQAIVDVLERKHKRAEISLLTTYVGTADFTWWVEAYLADEYGYDKTVKQFLRPPKGVERDALVAYDIQHSGLVYIILTNKNGDTKVLEYRPTDTMPIYTYVHCAYRIIESFKSGDTETRDFEIGDEEGTNTTTETVERGGSTRVITTTTTVEISDGKTSITTQSETQVTSEVLYFFYRIGLGRYPELDALVHNQVMASPYYPSIPLRVDNKDYTTEEHQKTQLFKTSEKFLDKLGINIHEIADSINDNEQIDEIDYAFIVFGVDLKTEHWATKEYLWRFFKHLDGMSMYVKNDFQQWEDSGGPSNGSPKTNTLRIRHPRFEKDRYNIELQWQYIDTSIESGSIGKIGEIEITSGTGVTWNFGGTDMVLDASTLYVRKQITENSYEEMRVVGLVYENHVYNGHSVILTTHDAFDDPDENGFIIPLNRAILQEMSLKYVTQLAYNCTHVVFNSYQVVKKRWYQRGWFKVLLVVVAIVITAWTMGADGGAAMSWATTAATSIAGAGASALLISYLAATIYVLGAMVLSTILIEGSSSLFGEEWGQVIGAIATMVVMNWGNWQNTLNNMSKQSLTASQVMRGSIAVVDTYNSYVQGQIIGLAEQMEEERKEYEHEYERIQELYKEFFNPNAGLLDIEGFIDASNHFMYESPNTFFSRTLLTGSDVARITNSMIENFADLGLELPTSG